MSAVVAVDRRLLERVSSALAAASTKAGHLAQRVGHEHLGYCAYGRCNERCIEHRALRDDVDAALADE